MRKFLLRAWLAGLGLFGLFRVGWVEAHVVTPYTDLQARVAQMLFGPPVQPIFVGLACSGTDVLALCVGTILAYPAAWRRRLGGVAGGLVLIFGLNTVRIGTLGLAAGNPARFEALHLYIWPGALVIAVAAYVFWWMRSVDPQAPIAEPQGERPGLPATTSPPPFLSMRFIVLAAVFLVAFVAASPYYLENALVLKAAVLVAQASATVLRLWGIDATASEAVLRIPQGGFLVTQECLSTPLIPIYGAAVFAYAHGWRRVTLGLAAAVPLFMVLGMARLLVVALPLTFVGSPLVLVHAFFQVTLGAVLVVAAAIWRAGAIGPAVRASLLGLLGGGVVAWLFAYTPMAAWMIAAAPAPDPQGAVAFAPVFQAGLYGGLWIAAGVRTPWRRLALGALVLLLAQVAFLGVLHLLAREGMILGVREVRAWAIVAPLAILFIAAWPRRSGSGTATRAGDPGYQGFWFDVGATFPDLRGAPSTTYYADNERRLLTEHLAPLAGVRLVKTDLWDEARNTRILQWAAAQGAVAFGVDISPPTVHLAREAFAGTPLRAAAADVRALPYRTGSIDAVYSMGTIEHFDETEQAVAEIFRVLKPGGRAIVGVPNRYDPFLRAPMVAVMSVLGLYAYGFEKSYSRRALREMLERAGFRVRAESAILFIPGWLRMVDLACHVRCRPLTVITGALVQVFVLLDRHVPAVRRHGYLLATVVEKPGILPA